MKRFLFRVRVLDTNSIFDTTKESNSLGLDGHLAKSGAGEIGVKYKSVIYMKPISKLRHFL